MCTSFEATTGIHLGLPTACPAARRALQVNGLPETVTDLARSKADSTPIMRAVTRRMTELVADEVDNLHTWDDITTAFTRLSAVATEELLHEDDRLRAHAITAHRRLRPKFWQDIDRFSTESSPRVVGKLTRCYQMLVGEAVSEGVATAVATHEVIPWVVVRENPELQLDIAAKRVEMVTRSSVGFVLEWAALGKHNDRPLARHLARQPVGRRDSPFPGLRFDPEALEIAHRVVRQDHKGEMLTLTPAARNSYPNSHHVDDEILTGCPAYPDIVSLYRAVGCFAARNGLRETTLMSAHRDRGVPPLESVRPVKCLDFL